MVFRLIKFIANNYGKLHPVVFKDEHGNTETRFFRRDFITTINQFLEEHLKEARDD